MHHTAEVIENGGTCLAEAVERAGFRLTEGKADLLAIRAENPVPGIILQGLLTRCRPDAVLLILPAEDTAVQVFLTETLPVLTACMYRAWWQQMAMAEPEQNALFAVGVRRGRGFALFRFPVAMTVPGGAALRWRWMWLMEEIALSIREAMQGKPLRESREERFFGLISRYFRVVVPAQAVETAPPDVLLTNANGTRRRYGTIFSAMGEIGEGRIREACRELKARSRDEGCILMASAPVDDVVKVICEAEYAVTVWDLANLLYLMQELPDLRGELEQLLGYDLTKIDPRMPCPRLNRPLLPPRSPVADWRERFARLPTGLKHATAYERLCTDALQALLADCLELWEEQVRVNGGSGRIDLLCRISINEQQDFFETLRRSMNSRYVVFEFKNSRKSATRGAIRQVVEYLNGDALRRVGVIISRRGASENEWLIAGGMFREQKKLILFLTDADLLHMLAMKAQGERHPAEYLSEKLDEWFIRLGK